MVTAFSPRVSRPSASPLKDFYRADARRLLAALIYGADEEEEYRYAFRRHIDSSAILHFTLMIALIYHRIFFHDSLHFRAF